jgi:hypothetical protein
MTDPGDEHQEPKTLQRLQQELQRVRDAARAARVDAEIHRKAQEECWQRFHAAGEEERDLLRAIARAGGGMDTDYYRRKRDNPVGVIVMHGAHPIVEDKR